jgi:hypothetical protein
MTSNVSASQHETATISAFVAKGRQERFLFLISDPKKRKKFTAELGHFRWFDRRFATPVAWKPDPTLSLWGRHVDAIAKLAQMLRSKGAGPACHVISVNSAVDGKEVELEEALEHASGSMGCILSCVPGKLAYFSGEDENLLLVR